MTLPAKEHTDNFRESLKRLFETVGDTALSDRPFERTEFPDVLTTTWEDLLSKELIEHLPGTENELLTGRGWVAGLLISRQNDLQTFKQRIAALFAELKSHVKGRKAANLIPLAEVANKTGLPEGWIYNIIEGKYLEERYRRRGASWAKKGRLVLIPIAFNIESVDLATLINAEVLKRVEEVEDELEVARDELSEYRCPYCGAAQNSSGGVQLNEHYDGYYRIYECGYRTMDRSIEHLCPKDPQFPSLDDFELRTQQTSHGEWICYVLPKTKQASKIDLSSAPTGKTEEEARERMIEKYRHLKGELKWNEMWPFGKPQT